VAIETEPFTGSNGTVVTTLGNVSAQGSGTAAEITVQGNQGQTGGADCPLIGNDKGNVEHYVQMVLQFDLAAAAAGTGKDRFALWVSAVDRNAGIFASHDSAYGGAWGIYSGTGRIDSVGGHPADAGTVVKLRREGVNAVLAIDGTDVLSVDVSGLGFDANTVAGFTANWNTGTAVANVFGDDYEDGLLTDGGTPTATAVDVSILIVPDNAQLGPVQPVDVEILITPDNAALSSAGASALTVEDVTVLAVIDNSALSNASVPLTVEDVSLPVVVDNVPITASAVPFPNADVTVLVVVDNALVGVPAAPGNANAEDVAVLIEVANAAISNVRAVAEDVTVLMQVSALLLQTAGSFGSSVVMYRRRRRRK
jgi:hypothetical protein